MKNLKYLFLVSLLTLFFSCDKRNANPPIPRSATSDEIQIQLATLAEQGQGDNLEEVVACLDGVKKLLRSWNVVQDEAEWRRRPSLGTYRLSVLVPTSKFGEWVQVESNPYETRIVRKSFEEYHMAHFVKENGCRPQLENEKVNYEQITENHFTDQQLKKLREGDIKEQKARLVYVWSTNMVWSVEGINQVLESTKSNGIELTMVTDNLSSYPLFKIHQKKYNLPEEAFTINQSFELLQREVKNHYPAYLLYPATGGPPKIVYGHMQPKHLANFIRENMGRN